MTDPEEAMAVAAARLAGDYRVSMADALSNISRALHFGPGGLDHVEAIYWFATGWMAGRGRDANTSFIAAPRVQPRGWKGAGP